MRSTAKLDSASIALRIEILKQVRRHGGGAHIGPAFSVLEMLRAVYEVARGLGPGIPNTSRDRIILSKGHGCLALYAVLAARGFFSKDELSAVGTLGARLAGHPERDLEIGIEATTGSLGHGLPIAVGMALASRLQGLGRVFVICGDGELNEGAVWEAALHAAKHKLSNLIVLVDRNRQQCNGPTEQVLPMSNLLSKWRSFGFEADSVDGHSLPRLVAKLNGAPSGDRPLVLLCETVKNRGVVGREADISWHYRSQLSAIELEEIIAAIKLLELT
jgi:transketolase